MLGRHLYLLALFLQSCHPDNLDILDSVNTQVNAIKYPGALPCQQYVKEKHKRLLAKDIPEDDMSVIYGLTYSLVPHVVLKAEGYYLDNQYPEISNRPRMAVINEIPAEKMQWAKIR